MQYVMFLALLYQLAVRYPKYLIAMVYSLLSCRLSILGVQCLEEGYNDSLLALYKYKHIQTQISYFKITQSRGLSLNIILGKQKQALFMAVVLSTTKLVHNVSFPKFVFGFIVYF